MSAAAWSTFDRRGRDPYTKTPAVGIHRAGRLHLNRAAWELLGSPERVELLADAQRGLIGFRASSEPHAYKCYQPVGMLGRYISAHRFLKHLGLFDTPTRELPAHMDAGVLVAHALPALSVPQAADQDPKPPVPQGTTQEERA